MNSYLLWMYLIATFVASFYAHLNALNFSDFVLGGLITYILFIGIYFLLRDIKKTLLLKQILRVLGILILMGLIYVSFVLGLMYGFNSADCYQIEATNIFTGNSKAYCNVPPWYTEYNHEDERLKW